MKRVLILNFFLIISWSSCRKVLDLKATEYFTISQIVNSKNCKAKCKQTPTCEKQFVKVKALLDEVNIFPEENRFFIIDLEGENGNQKLIWEVKVAPSASKMIFQKIKNRPSTLVELEGKISSYDATVKKKCVRLFQLYLDKTSQINFL